MGTMRQLTTNGPTTHAALGCTADPRLPLWHEAFFGLEWLSLKFSAVYRGLGITL